MKAHPVDMDGKPYRKGQTVLLATNSMGGASPNIERRYVVSVEGGVVRLSATPGEPGRGGNLRRPSRHFILEDHSKELAFLQALESCGVDNWEGYSEAYREAYGAEEEEEDED